MHLVKIDGVYMYRFHKVLDAGVGAGAMIFSGDGFDRFSRLTLTPLSLSLMPLAWIGDQTTERRLRFLRLRYAETYVTKGITGADFGSTSRYATDGGQFLKSFRVVVDLGVLFHP